MGLWSRLFDERDRAVGAAVLVRERAPFSLDDVITGMRARAVAAKRDDAAREGMGVVVGDQRAIILPEFPDLPRGYAAELAASAWWWPEAEDVCSGLEHVIAVGVPEGTGARIERRRLVSEVALAVAALTSAPAILWRDGEALHAPPAFAAHLDDECSTHELWISVRVAEQAGVRFFYTTGLESFGQREIEMDVPPNESRADAALLHHIAGRVIAGGRIPIGTFELGDRRLAASVDPARIPLRRDAFRLRW